MDEVVSTLMRAYEREGLSTQALVGGIDDLEKRIKGLLGEKWFGIKHLAGIAEKGDGIGTQRRHRALVLLYAHFMRIPIAWQQLQEGPYASSLFHNCIFTSYQSKIASSYKPPPFSL